MSAISNHIDALPVELLIFELPTAYDSMFVILLGLVTRKCMLIVFLVYFILFICI